MKSCFKKKETRSSSVVCIIWLAWGYSLQTTKSILETRAHLTNGFWNLWNPDPDTFARTEILRPYNQVPSAHDYGGVAKKLVLREPLLEAVPWNSECDAEHAQRLNTRYTTSAVTCIDPCWQVASTRTLNSRYEDRLCHEKHLKKKKTHNSSDAGRPAASQYKQERFLLRFALITPMASDNYQIRISQKLRTTFARMEVLRPYNRTHSAHDYGGAAK